MPGSVEGGGDSVTGLLDRIALQGATEVVDVYDPLELDTTSTITRRLASNMHMYRYMLLDLRLLRQTFREPIVRHTTCAVGPILLCNVGDRFATQLDIGGNGLDAYCFNRMVTGRLTVAQNGREVTSHGHNGTAFRASAGTRTTASDDSGRNNTWFNAAALEQYLEQLIVAIGCAVHCCFDLTLPGIEEWRRASPGCSAFLPPNWAARTGLRPIGWHFNRSTTFS